MKTFFIFLLLTFSFASLATAETSTAYRYHGDGVFSLRSNHTSERFEGRFRNEDGTYNEAALKKINLVFQANYNKPETRISTRLLEFIDFLQDHFQGGVITLSSGYRSPVYNQNLRNKGKLAAKASLHQYGMAADLKIQGVASKEIWEYVRDLGFGGAGYYSGDYLHIDTGPARFWDQNTSKVGTDISDDNKLLLLVPEKDIYTSEKALAVKVARITAWPLFLSPQFTLIKNHASKRKQKKFPLFPEGINPSDCHAFHTVKELSHLRFHFPKKIKSGSYTLQATLCRQDNPKTPSKIETTPFRIER